MLTVISHTHMYRKDELVGFALFSTDAALKIDM